MPFSAQQRKAGFESLEETVFDLAVIGGGITGVSVARNAALRGYSVVLLEQGDLACGTSSRSSRLIHGGLRYLEHAEFGLVFESLRERALLAHTARHLVRPLRFVFPVYQRDRRSLFEIKVGLWLYDTLALFRNHRRHARISRGRLSMLCPRLRITELTGAVTYYDYRTDDARLVLENAIDAGAAGATVLSYARVERIQSGAGRYTTLAIHDQLGGRGSLVHCHAVVSATGPWTDRLLTYSGAAAQRPRLKPTKGVHIVVPGDELALKTAVVLQHPFDQRVLFALPYYEHVVLGTTDTFFNGNPRDVRATRYDVDYLLAAAKHYFPGVPLGRNRVISNWAGVRPLVSAETNEPGAVSREHRIEIIDGMVVIAGGKLTTYRKMAQECADVALELVCDRTGKPLIPNGEHEDRPLPGAVGLNSDEDLERLGKRLGQTIEDREAGEHLALTYGSRADLVAQYAKANRKLAARMLEDLPYIWAQVVHAAREEMALSVTDVMVRRTQIFYRDPRQGLSVVNRVAQIMARELGWRRGETLRQIVEYQTFVERSRTWLND